ncbi:hypothetical protein K490DRAFT_57282 [Saccharata proteae CBS 121410]|uniref:UDENN FLCN/SMCR8-type domain-containing protein n=1 Tax=Saccharata proteae CBS 121410 TaxID=1314787 RepID=A0A9P4HWB7_9PEZI|nr:hypothetical protein K490DRAFT_57282 [Saccharata proteae CBS 121410]
MDFIISLAHFCEIHGPTTILCTQISQGACASCHDCSTPPADYPPSKSDYFASPPCDSLRPHDPLAPPFQTPPTSPRSPKHNPYFPAFADTKPFTDSSPFSGDGDPSCENCTFDVPKTVADRLPSGAPGSPTKDGRSHHGSPVLRTSQNIIARGAGARSGSRSTSPSSSASTNEERSQVSTSFSSSQSAPSLAPSSPSSPLFPPSRRDQPHTHTLTYLTTRQPVSPASYAFLRRSCLRTLCCESLPRSSASGSLYFGDPNSGYTISYIFRIPDPRARGRLRTYALIAFGGQDSWRVSKAMSRITETFESIANQIIAMANKVLEQETALMSTGPQVRPNTAATANGSVAPPSPFASHLPSLKKEKSKSTTTTTTSPPPRNLTPVSSFLAAKKVDPDGYPRLSGDMGAAKGLSEIVGKENFFVELHARFCMLLSGLVKDFGTGQR